MNMDLLSFMSHEESVIDLSLMDSDKERQIFIEWLESYANE